jgi:hypothetical protein
VFASQRKRLPINWVPLFSEKNNILEMVKEMHFEAVLVSGDEPRRRERVGRSGITDSFFGLAGVKPSPLVLRQFEAICWSVVPALHDIWR